MLDGASACPQMSSPLPNISQQVSSSRGAPQLQRISKAPVESGSRVIERCLHDLSEDRKKRPGVH
jgi:hypothetical protein